MVSITLVVVGMLVVMVLVLGLTDITTLVVAIHVVFLRSVKEIMQVYIVEIHTIANCATHLESQ